MARTRVRRWCRQCGRGGACRSPDSCRISEHRGVAALVPRRRQTQPSDLFPVGRPPRASRRLTSASASGLALRKSRPTNQVQSSRGLRPSRSRFAIAPPTARCPETGAAASRPERGRAEPRLWRSPRYTEAGRAASVCARLQERFLGRVCPGRSPPGRGGKAREAAAVQGERLTTCL